MAVLRSKRTLSQFEFEHSFSTLYQFTSNKIGALPKRRHQWLGLELSVKMNNIFDKIMEVNEGYFPRETKKEQKQNLINSSIKELLSTEKPLMVLWNIEGYSTKQMVAWVTLFNNELEILNKMLDEPCDTQRIQILDWRAIMSVKFMSNIFELHRIIHGKVVRMPSKFDNTHSSLLINLIDEAMYSLVKANSKIPKTAEEYKKRRENMSNAISALHKIQRPLIFFFNVMQYSEKTLEDITKRIDEELKMLYALTRSDKERFGALK